MWVWKGSGSPNQQLVTVEAPSGTDKDMIGGVGGWGGGFHQLVQLMGDGRKNRMWEVTKLQTFNQWLSERELTIRNCR